MQDFVGFGKFLILTGIITTSLGIFLTASGKIPFFGKLPGDLSIKGENFTFYFPIVSSIVISLLLTFILNIVFRK